LVEPPLPQWDGIICGTGIGQFLADWFRHANTSIVAGDLRELNTHTPAALRMLFDEYRNAGGGVREPSSSVIHLGFDYDERRFVGWTYRSGNSFEPEEMEYGQFFRPYPENTEDLEIKALRDFIAVGERQKAEDRARPLNKRVGIGGYLILYMMQSEEAGDSDIVLTTVSRLHEFSDHYDDYLQACERLHADNLAEK
jgi:hypothetical protein